MFCENDKVTVNASRVPWNEVTIGTVENISYSPFLHGNVYLVRLENGDLVKCLEEDLKEVTEEKVEEPVEEKEKTITLTRKELATAILKASTPSNLRKVQGMKDLPNHLMLELALTGIIIGDSLEKVLFDEKAEND